MVNDKTKLGSGTAAIDLTGQVAIVTGGARGIGGAVTRLFAAQGAHVVIADVLEEAGQELAAELGANVSFARHDVSDEGGWEKIVAKAVEAHGKIDALVNCAGILIRETITSFDLAKFEKVMRINLIGTFLGIKHVGAAMVKNKAGSIVNFSSVEGLHGSVSMAAYASSKWAVRGLTKVAAAELGVAGIRVNSIHPGPINTPMLNPAGLPISDIDANALVKMMPLQRVAEPLEVAQLCLYLVSDASSFVSGTEVVIDGGMTGTRLYNFH